MNTSSSRGQALRLSWRAVVAATMFAAFVPAQAQLFTNLQAFGARLKAGDPTIDATNSIDGPKGLATADFDGDTRPDLAVANTDGSLTVWFGRPQGKFSAPTHLRTGVEELRGIVAADFTGDGRPDLAAAAPYSGKVFLFPNTAGGFAPAVELITWYGARNLTAGDFDGDGLADLAVAGTTNGLRQLRNTGGAFETVTNITSLAYLDTSFYYEFPKPLYVLGAFRPAGETQDKLIATHADSALVWVLAADASGALGITGVMTNQRLHALTVGPVTQNASSAQLDLVTASRDYGTIEVHRGTYGPVYFEQAATQRIQVPGGPRAVSLVDLNGDGWNEVVVVQRNFDRVLTYENSNGVLRAGSEMQVGRSPRELVTADFNSDGRPDVAVMNRVSMDVSVLFTHPHQSGFSGLDLVYPVDGSVSGLSVFDFNRDGRDDVVQLHRASAEFSVRLSATNGLLGPPTFFSVGNLPSAQSAVDVNNDGISDMVTANLGQNGVEGGSVSVRLGTGSGSFGPETRYVLPTTTGGSLFALVAADFDNDSNIDLAAGFYDCRIAFYRGNGSGGFTLTRTDRFTYESRVMVTGDFDQDGDTDIAGAGYAGDVVVIENTGDLFTGSTLTRYDYPPPGSNKYGTRDIVAGDVNNDGDPDLIIGSGSGAMLFLGGPGMTFGRVSDSLPGTDFPAAGLALGDFDGNGSTDIAVSCRARSCVTILTRENTNSPYEVALVVDVPAGEFLASGDLDGDGQDDLVGSGSVLWTALSSRRAQPAPPAMSQLDRPTVAVPVINEILAVNTSLPLDPDGDRNSDWVEFYNAGASALPLNGWKVRYTEAGGVTQEFPFPPTAFFAPNTHLIVVFSETRRTLYHTGFRLSGNGGVLSLINAGGVVVDTIQYAVQQENVSYGRFRDGSQTFSANPYPSPGRPNTDNGPVEPIAQLQDFYPLPAVAGQPIRLSVTGRDDVGLVGVSVVWQRMDISETNIHRTQIFDDGMHDDGPMLDGLFAGLLPALPAGAEIQFYLEVTDLGDQTITLPSEPVFAIPGQPVTLYSLTIGGTPPPLEISEFVASNTNGLRDELNLTPDWVEIRNTSTGAVSLSGVSLTRQFFGNGNRFTFAATNSLAPGEHLVLYCDGNADAGPLHAPFSLDRGGDQLLLTGVSSNGARLLVDSIAFGLQENDIALARLGAAGSWRAQTPTPGAPNVPGTWLGLVSSDGANFTLAFPTTTNATYTVQYADSLDAPVWTSLPSLPGDGLEKVVTQPTASQRYYRVRRDP